MAIRRDMTALRGIVPISSIHGRYGGVCLISGYDKNKVYLTRDEEELLINLMNEMEGKDILLIKLILHKFSMPQIIKAFKQMYKHRFIVLFVNLLKCSLNYNLTGG